MAAEDQAQKDQARGEAAVQRLSKETPRPVIQIVASGVVGTVMAAGAAGLIINQLPKTVPIIPTFICLLVVLAPTLSVAGHWFFTVRPERIQQKLDKEAVEKRNYEEAIQKKWKTEAEDGLLEQKESTDDDQEEDEVEDDVIRCPRCRSEEVVLDSREPAAWGAVPGTTMDHSKYDWHCNACGNQWQYDDPRVAP
jgi:hypothetical protein